MIPILLTAELTTEFCERWQEDRQYITLKLGHFDVAKFPAETYIRSERDQETISYCVAEWLRKKLI